MNYYPTKKTILIIEDNSLIREMLREVLEDDYNILEAADGLDGLDVLKENYKILSAIMLDLIMPRCDGFEFMKKVQGDKHLASVPIVVLTGSFSADVEAQCMSLGAVDFLLKPFNTTLVKRRINSIIRMREVASFVSTVELDELTGVYTKSAFFYYAKQFLEANSDKKYDLTILDIENLRIVNSIYGEMGGDALLKHTARIIQRNTKNEICGRYDGDKFVAFTDSTRPDKVGRILSMMKEISKNAPIPNVVTSCGVYTEVNSELTISTMCDRALFALRSAKHNYDRPFAVYDETLSAAYEESQIFVSMFENGLRNEEFEIWYQPKFYAKTEKLAGFEALVRWRRPDGELIPPGRFIPIFEQDGMIARLDEYVFRKTCQAVRKRMDEGKNVYPVSVNLSRKSLYSENMIERYRDIVKEEGVSLSLIPIELTESATVLSLPIEDLTDGLKNAGFDIYMDDFGAGVSSLASFVGLPFDSVKLDKSLIDYIGDQNGNEMIRHTIEMAHFKNMKVVAEGVETWEQLNFLKSVDCDMIQGYYYSPPKPLEEIDQMIEEWERKSVGTEVTEEDEYESEQKRRFQELAERLTIVQSLSKFFYSAYYLDMSDKSFMELQGWTDARTIIDTHSRADEQFYVMCEKMIPQKYRAKMLEFTDISTLNERMKDVDVISTEFEGKTKGWSEASFIVHDRDKNGQILHAFYATRSIKDEKEKELIREREHLEELRENLMVIQSLSDMFYGIYQIDLKNGLYNEISSTPRMFDAAGVAGIAGETLADSITKFVKPEYIQAMSVFCDLNTLQERLHHQQSDAFIFEEVHRGWTQCIFNVSERDAEGNAIKVLLLFKDVSEEKSKETLYQLQNYVFEALTREYEDVFLVDTEKNISYTYKTSNQMVKNPYERQGPFDLVGAHYADNYVFPDDRDRVKKAFEITKLKQILSANGEFEVIFRTLYKGMVHHRQATFVMPHFYNPQMPRNLLVLGLKQIDRLVEEERRRNEELRTAKEKAEHDPLTGLLNKGAFEELQKLFEKRNDVALLIVDIDRFKLINDNYGHSVGDDVIRFVSNLLSNVFRTSDYVARIGGDEFAIIMTAVSEKAKDIILAKAEELREQLRVGLSELPSASVSIGVAMSYNCPNKQAKEMFKCADLALYYVKENGRDGIAFYSDLPKTE